MDKYFEEIKKRSQKYPPSVFHYTTAGGFVGIISDQGFHATCVFHLNDSQENERGKRVAAAVIKRLATDAKSLARRTFLGALEASLPTVSEYPPPVVCFSEEGDLLSQWRAYSEGQSGFSIGFDTRNLGTRAFDRVGFLAKCVYETSEQEHLLGIIIVDAADDFEKAHAGASDEQGRVDAASSAVVEAITCIAHAAAYFKHLSFREEKEWRVVLQPFGMGAAVSKFRTSGGRIVPYKEFDIKEDTAGPMIRSVIIGPTPHARATAFSVSEFLKTQLLPDVRVTHSDTPYISW